VTSTKFTAVLLAWYAQHARDLPWRGQNDPYAVWVSEIMLQQTRVETVIPYFTRWMERFPTLHALAHSTEQEVLKLWEGLGYYSRARNLHRAARLMVEQYGGEFPRDLKELRRLPGIGRYTAGAIASIAFGVDAPALDGNIRRVLARLFNVAEPIRSSQGERRLWELAAMHLPPGRAAAYNQALMDLGATICTPQKPACDRCPIRQFCQAWQLGVQDERPVRLQNPATPHHVVTAAVIRKGEQVLLAQRPKSGLLGGLWEFPGGKLQAGESLTECLQREIREELGAEICVQQEIGVYRHAYTHFRVTLHAYHCSLKDGAHPRPLQVEDIRWATLTSLNDYPMGKIDRLIARDLIRLAETQENMHPVNGAPASPLRLPVE
jgi:A/G-specific adenine glycosylase